MLSFGAIIRAGQTPLLPGGYLRITSGAPMPITTRGVVAIVGRSNWGLLNVAQLAYSIDDITRMYGPNSSIGPLAAQAFAGGAIALQTVRAGSAGTPGTVQVTTSVAGNAPTLALTGRSPGVRTLSVSLRNSTALPGTFEMVVYENGAPLEVVNLGATNTGDAFMTAINAVGTGSQYITAAPVGAAPTNVALTLVTQAALVGGADPTVNAAAFDTARQALTNKLWFALVEDSEDPIEHAAMLGFVDAQIQNGSRRIAVAAQDLGSVALSSILSLLPTLNDPAFQYVVNNFKTNAGIVTGKNAAAWYAGLLSAMLPTYTASLRTVPGAIDIPNLLTASDQLRVQAAGGVAFIFSHRQAVMTGRAVTTYSNVGAPPIWAESANQNWFYVDRTVRVFEIVDDVMSAVLDRIADPNPGNRPHNNQVGLTDLLSAAQIRLDSYKPNALNAETKVVQDTVLSADPSTLVRLRIDPFSDVFGVDTVVLTIKTI